MKKSYWPQTFEQYLEYFILYLEFISVISSQLSLLAEVGFGGCLLYVDPCDASFGNKTFGVTLNPGGNPLFREDASNGKYLRLHQGTVAFLRLY